MIKKDAQARRIGIFGASGSGKTTKALDLVAKVNRLIAFDPLDDLTQIKTRISDLEYLKKFVLKNYAKSFRVRFVPNLAKAKEQLSEISLFLRELQAGYKFNRHNALVTLFVDELDTSFPLNISRSMGENGFYFLCCRGRHYGINIVGNSQRMSLVDLPFRANLSDLFVFRLADFNDIKAATQMLGTPYRQRIIDLTNFKYIYKNPEGVIK